MGQMRNDAADTTAAVDYRTVRMLDNMENRKKYAALYQFTNSTHLKNFKKKLQKIPNWPFSEYQKKIPQRISYGSNPSYYKATNYNKFSKKRIVTEITPKLQMRSYFRPTNE